MEIELRNKKFIRIDNRAEYIFNRYMVTVIEKSGRRTEREYKIVNRGDRDYIALDGLYYRIFQVDSIITIELSEGTIELINQEVLNQLVK